MGVAAGLLGENDRGGLVIGWGVGVDVERLGIGSLVDPPIIGCLGLSVGGRVGDSVMRTHFSVASPCNGLLCIEQVH